MNANDYVVLNPIGELSHLDKDEIAVGVRNFSLAGQNCLMEYTYEGKKYKRVRTGFIPKSIVGEVCSVQIYKLLLEEEKTEFIIGGRTWKFVKELPNYNLWTADYLCSDGDGVELYIEKDNGGFELECFSGIPASKIYIDLVDFGVFQCAPNKIEEFDFREPFEQQCARIADYLCGKFCEFREK